ncbi:MAG: type II toxin-antitoxin system PemK/MazF family toxin [Burkholderiaceae bacterium]
MQRGDIVTVSLPGDYGKPRPALIIQSDLLRELDSVLICPITSILRNVLFRVTLEPSPVNGLQKISQVMVDKTSPIPRAKVSKVVGSINAERMKNVERALMLVTGLS